MILGLISLVIIAAYTTAVCIKQKGVPYSISATFYKLKHPYWFMATMWLTAGLLMPVILEVSKPNTEFLAFLACVGMFLVGSAPNFKEDFEGKVHDAGAVMCLVFSQAWVMFNCPWCLLVWIGYIVYTVIAISKQRQGVLLYKFLLTKPMFWVEVCSLLATYMAFAFKLLLKSF